MGYTFQGEITANAQPGGMKWKKKCSVFNVRSPAGTPDAPLPECAAKKLKLRI